MFQDHNLYNQRLVFLMAVSCPIGWKRGVTTKTYLHYCDFPGGAVVKNLPANGGESRDVGLILGSGRSPGVGSGNPLQYSCLENSMDRGASWVTVHEVRHD